MRRFLIGILLTALLGGCVIVPWDDDYRGGGHEHRHDWGDRHEGSGNWGGHR